MNSVARIDDHAMAPVADQGASLMAVISRAASDPNVDMDKMDRLLLMQHGQTEEIHDEKELKRAYLPVQA